MVSWAYVYWFVPCSVNLGHPDLSRWWLRWREPFASRLPEPLLSQDFLSCRWVIYVMGFIYSASSGRRHRTPFLFITVYLARKIWRLPRAPCADLSLIHRAKSVDRRLVSSEKPSGRVLLSVLCCLSGVLCGKCERACVCGNFWPSTVCPICVLWRANKPPKQYHSCFRFWINQVFSFHKYVSRRV